MIKTLLLDLELVHESWLPFFSASVINELLDIKKSIGTDFTPSYDRVLKFTKNDLSKVTVIILGQDPYPQVGAATGCAFEVNGLKSWNNNFRQSSLKNILKLIYKTYHGELIEYSEIKDRIAQNKFSILPPCHLFKNWETQGVLLLNIYLTCKIHSPKSHRMYWISFTKKVIEYIKFYNDNVYWFLWGNEVQKAVKNIHLKNTITCNHPMICSPKKRGSFVNSNCFDITKHMIDWTGCST